MQIGYGKTAYVSGDLKEYEIPPHVRRILIESALVIKSKACTLKEHACQC